MTGAARPVPRTAQCRAKDQLPADHKFVLALCTLARNHAGDHADAVTEHTWPCAEPATARYTPNDKDAE